MANLKDLPKDIYDILTSENDNSIQDTKESTKFASNLVGHINRATTHRERTRSDKVLYASEIGKPCVRQLYYNRTASDQAEPIQGHARYKFLYGDIIEEVTLQLARQAGHEVTHEQAELHTKDVLGTDWKIRGRCDAVIDGTIIDVKSASGFAMKKYMKEGINSLNDSFGYREQLHYYASVLADTEDLNASSFFLFVGKELGQIALIENKIDHEEYETKLKETIRILDDSLYSAYFGAPERPHAATRVKVEDNGNESLKPMCSYCPYKKLCYGDSLRAFRYSTGPKFYVEVKKEPRVDEVAV